MLFLGLNKGRQAYNLGTLVLILEGVKAWGTNGSMRCLRLA